MDDLQTIFALDPGFTNSYNRHLEYDVAPVSITACYLDERRGIGAGAYIRVSALAFRLSSICLTSLKFRHPTKASRRLRAFLSARIVPSNAGKAP